MTPQDPPRRLGRGLDALLAARQKRTETTPRASYETEDRPRGASGGTVSSSPTQSPEDAHPEEHSKRPVDGTLTVIPLSLISPNPYQPRKEFRQEELSDLEESLRSSGLLQPITVRSAPVGSGYELIAGERRLRAAQNLGWSEIPAIVREADERTLLTLAMIENLQRSDLDPIEEADGYQRLADEFSLSQQEIADLVGKNRTTITNALRLLQLPASVRRMLQEKQLTAGHARALLSLGDETRIAALARQVVSDGMSVREVERHVKRVTADKTKLRETEKSTPPLPQSSSAHLRRIEDLLKRRFQTAASVYMATSDSGEVRIRFFSTDDLERLLLEFGIDPERG